MAHSSPLLERLRQTTRLAHRRLERRVGLFEPNFDIHRYRRLLQDFWGFYRPLERKLAVLADDLLPLPYSLQRPKAPRLWQDLLSLGMTESDIAALPLCGRLPVLPTAAQAFGVLYVIEGATPGGQVVISYLREKLRITPGQGGSFFDSYGPLVDQYWNEFQTAMMTAVEEPWLQDLTIQAAIDTFDCFEAWLTYRHRAQDANYAQWIEYELKSFRAPYFDSLSGAA